MKLYYKLLILISIIYLNCGCMGTALRFEGSGEEIKNSKNKESYISKPIGWMPLYGIRTDLGMIFEKKEVPLQEIIGFISIPIDLIVDVVVFPGDLLFGLIGWKIKEPGT